MEGRLSTKLLTNSLLSLHLVVVIPAVPFSRPMIRFIWNTKDPPLCINARPQPVHTMHLARRPQLANAHTRTLRGFEPLSDPVLVFDTRTPRVEFT